MKKDNLFWISYSDIMTSLFFIMLVLFIVGIVAYNSKNNKVKNLKQEKSNLKKEKNVLEKEKKEIESIQKALSSLNPNYFKFDQDTKRYRLNIDVRFQSNKSNIHVVSDSILNELYKAGKSLYQRVDSLTNVNKEVYYLLIIQGNTQRNKTNFKRYPDVGYRLSYKRALALYNFWKQQGLDFNNFGKRCELIIAGSGYFGLSRYPEGSKKNRRFTLQITSKWKLKQDSTQAVMRNE